MTEILNYIEQVATNGSIKIRFHKGRYSVCGLLIHINEVNDHLSRRNADAGPRLQLDFADDSFASLSHYGPPSLICPNGNLQGLYVHQESNIEESGSEFFTTYTGVKAGDGQESCGWQGENSVTDASERSETTQMSASVESSIAEMQNHSAHMSDTVAGVCDKKDVIIDAKATEEDVNYKSASDADKHDKSCTVDRSVDTSDRVAVGIEEHDKRGISAHDGDKIIDTNSCSSIEDNQKTPLEPNKEQENEAVSDERLLDPEVWDYMQEMKSDQLREVLDPFGASYKSEWDSSDGVYRVRLVIQNQSTNEALQKSIALACEQFDRLYNELFASCHVVPIKVKYFSGDLSVNHIRREFPSIILKQSDDRNVLLIGPRIDVEKARDFIVSSSKRVLRMNKSFSTSRSRSSIDSTQKGDATEDRRCRSAIFPAEDSLTSAEDAESLRDRAESLKNRVESLDRLEEGLQSKSLKTDDEPRAKDERVSNQLVIAEKIGSPSPSHDGCGDGSATTEFEHLDDNDHHKSSSSDSFSILQSSPRDSFDDAEEHRNDGGT